MEIQDFIDLLQDALDESLDLRGTDQIEFFIGDSDDQRLLHLWKAGSASAVLAETGEDVNMMYIELMPKAVIDSLKEDDHVEH